MSRRYNNIFRYLYPDRCAVCDSALRTDERYLCRHCEGLPKRIQKDFCMKCGKPVLEGRFCELCKTETHTFTAGRSAFIYDRYMKYSMKHFKYYGRAEYARFYADSLFHMFWDDVRKIQADALIAVPIHENRKRKRGYNQSAVLAQEFGKLTGIPVYENFLKRTKDTIPQKDLSRRERLQNLSQVFSVNLTCRELSKQMNCVIIMDDIYTTGSTIEACARVLKDIQIQNIYFLCVCTGWGY